MFRRDLARYIKENNIPMSRIGDKWYYNANQLPFKEMRRMNRELGLHRLNHIGNKNGLKHNTV